MTTVRSISRARAGVRGTHTVLSRITRAIDQLWNGRSTAVSPIGNPLGREGERRAASFLRKAGYRILARNVRVRAGEADLVCRDPDASSIVIVEVKTRRIADGLSPGGVAAAPEASITAHKRRKLSQVVRALVRANRWHDRAIRVDVVAIEVDDRGARDKWTVRHHVDVLR